MALSRAAAGASAGSVQAPVAWIAAVSLGVPEASARGSVEGRALHAESRASARPERRESMRFADGRASRVPSARREGALRIGSARAARCAGAILHVSWSPPLAWQAQGSRGPGAELAGEPKLAAVRLDHALHEGEAEPSPLAFGGETEHHGALAIAG